MPDVDPLLPKRLRDNAAVRAGEARVYAATTRALDALAREIRSACADAHYAPTDTRSWPGWEAAVEAQILPALTRVYVGSYDDPRSIVAAASVNARQNATRYMRLIYNRLVRAADEVWAAVQAVLAAGVERHEAIPDIARRVDAALAEQGAERWRGRATTIARTETIAAFNNGRLDGGKALAAEVGVAERDVFKSWLATRTDDRARATHRAADRQTVPVNAAFTVGGARGAAPGDPMLPASECVNCRCTILVLLPGDRGYPEHHTPSPMTLAASGVLTFDFHPDQKRGPDGRFIKFLTQRDAFKSLALPKFWTPRDAEDQTISHGPEFRDWMRAGRPQDHPNALAFNRIRTTQRLHRKDTPPTTDNVLAWFRPSKNKDKDFPDNPKVGDVIQDQAPIATETQKPTHVKPKVLYAIRIPAGSEGIVPIADDTKYAYYQGASLPPGAKLQVSDVREENGQRLITVDLLPADVEPTPVVPKPIPEPAPVPEPTPEPVPEIPKVGQIVNREKANALPVGSRVAVVGGTVWEKREDGWAKDGSSAVLPTIPGGKVLRVGPGEDVKPTPAHKVGDEVTREEGQTLPVGTRVRSASGTEYVRTDDGGWESTGDVVSKRNDLPRAGGTITFLPEGAPQPKPKTPAPSPVADGRPRNTDPKMRATTPKPPPDAPNDPRVGEPVGGAEAFNMPIGTRFRDENGDVWLLGGTSRLTRDTDGSTPSMDDLKALIAGKWAIESVPSPGAWTPAANRLTTQQSIDSRARLTKKLPLGRGFDPIFTSAEMPAPGDPMSVQDAQKNANVFNHSYRGDDNGERRTLRSEVSNLRGEGSISRRAGSMESEFGINCQRVASAYEMRRRGYDVTAGAGSGGSTHILAEVWQDANGSPRTAEPFNSFKKMEARAALDGDGARYVVYGAWKAGGAHIWNAENVDGRLNFIEAQVKGSDGNGHSDRVSWRGKGGYEGAYLMRVDDLTPHESMFESGYLLNNTPPEAPAAAVGA